MKKTIELKLYAWQFAAAEFDEPYRCAISIAAMLHFNADLACEYLSGLKIDKGKKTINYDHKTYGKDSFYSDYEKALAANFSKTKVIRTIILKKPTNIW